MLQTRMRYIKKGECHQMYVLYLHSEPQCNSLILLIRHPLAHFHSNLAESLFLSTPNPIMVIFVSFLPVVVEEDFNFVLSRYTVNHVLIKFAAFSFFFQGDRQAGGPLCSRAGLEFSPRSVAFDNVVFTKIQWDYFLKEIYILNFEFKTLLEILQSREFLRNRWKNFYQFFIKQLLIVCI